MEGAQSSAQPFGANVFALASMIEKFTGDGQGPSITEFFDMLEQVGKMGGLTQEQQLGMAKCRMSGAAHDFAWRDEGVRNAGTFAEFKKLAFRYFDRDPPSVKLRRFLDARQKPGEDARAFASRLRFLGNDTLAREPGPDSAKQKHAKELLLEQMRCQFVTGLRDPVRRFVLSKAPTTFEGAIEAAVDEECNELLVGTEEKVRLVTEPQSGGVDASVAQLAERLDRLEALLAESLRSSDRGGYRKQERQRVRCYACKGYGHIARNCSRLSGEFSRANEQQITPADTTAEQRNTAPKNW